ncbi:MAG: 2-oxoisovalerate dehydrogenase [Candidatus Nephthysia bennettiae]|uniref:2-oxoisovalerate dehydrogenase subunit alpha n=1 Tax=Candidatus Nephthysia bennettiae TaxID=3127016 RepID=A0A934KD45_9BACT|nr:thiamine pyrophosphate-dependent dehydrogenase E1 component subunit alpha [Candidatus Dormibacteraeota bacterium]MBJ7613355.1 thiamine pyrophosphate-dependent dehydrogenase E1 component subunit alpha [Candidatus Dormibacteraeota bacterium]PZR86439.1 MAG: 2-oxoisovalerate dehydrogenase [Candidatus Dormibacteraeota bacterium]
MRAQATETGRAGREEHLRIHAWMCGAKALDDRMHALVRQGRAPFVGSSRGHEGIQVAATAALEPSDWLVPHYRGLGNAVARGLTAREWMLAVFAKSADPLSGGRNIPGGCFSHLRLRIAPVSQVVATWIPKAAGIAYASKLQGDGAVTLCTFGDGATSKGDYHEGLNFAAVHRLPVVFVCENNGYAISVPLRLQSGGESLAARAAGYGMAGETVDGTDVPACYQVAREAVARARAGEGPTLIEARIWRLNAHTSEDNQAKYRSPEELVEASDHDPLACFEAWLERQGWLSADEALRVRERSEREAAEAADWAESQPDPRAEDLSAHVYA